MIGADSDVLDGGGGADSLIGGIDTPLNIALGLTVPGVAQAVNFEHIAGGPSSDIFYLDSIGAFTVEGGTSAAQSVSYMLVGDVASFRYASAGVSISVGLNGSATVGDHTLISIEHIDGSDFADTITASGWGDGDYDENDMYLPTGVQTIRAGGGIDIIDVSAIGGADLVYGPNDGEDVIIENPHSGVGYFVLDGISLGQITFTHVATGATDVAFTDGNPEHWEKYTPVDWYVQISGGTTKFKVGEGSITEKWYEEERNHINPLSSLYLEDTDYYPSYFGDFGFFE